MRYSIVHSLSFMNRIDREKKVIGQMIEIFCRNIIRPGIFATIARIYWNMPSIDLSTVLKVHQKRVAGNAKFIAIHPFRKKESGK